MRKKSKSEGIRIRLKGLRSTHELRQMLNEAVNELERLAVPYVRGCNLYVTPVDEDGDTLVPRKYKFTIREPYNCAADEHGI